MQDSGCHLDDGGFLRVGCFESVSVRSFLATRLATRRSNLRITSPGLGEEERSRSFIVNFPVGVMETKKAWHEYMPGFTSDSGICEIRCHQRDPKDQSCIGRASVGGASRLCHLVPSFVRMDR